MSIMIANLSGPTVLNLHLLRPSCQQRILQLDISKNQIYPGHQCFIEAHCVSTHAPGEFRQYARRNRSYLSLYHCDIAGPTNNIFTGLLIILSSSLMIYYPVVHKHRHPNEPECEPDSSSPSAFSPIPFRVRINRRVSLLSGTQARSRRVTSTKLLAQRLC